MEADSLLKSEERSDVRKRERDGSRSDSGLRAVGGGRDRRDTREWELNPEP